MRRRTPRPSDYYPPEEAERRATEALRHALTTPPRPRRVIAERIARITARKREKRAKKDA